MYFLSQSVYFKIDHEINVEVGVTEDLGTTEIIDKNSDTIAEQWVAHYIVILKLQLTQL